MKRALLSALVAIPVLVLALIILAAPRPRAAMTQLPIAVNDLVGCLLLVTGIAKLVYVKDLEQVLERYWRVPDRYAPWLAHCLGTVEVVVGASLFWCALSPRPEAASAALFAAFAAMAVMLRLRGVRRAPCGCLGKDNRRPGWTLRLAARNGALAALAVASMGPRRVGASAAAAAVASAVAMLAAVLIAGLSPQLRRWPAATGPGK